MMSNNNLVVKVEMIEKLIAFLPFFSPLAGLFGNLAFFRVRPEQGARFATLSVWLGFLGSLAVWVFGLPRIHSDPSFGFHSNELSWLMVSLVLFVSGTVHGFSVRYMAGSSGYRRFFLLLTGLTLSVLLFLTADNLFLGVLFWSFSNLALVKLMAHHSRWKPAVQGANLALKTFGTGLLFYLLGCLLIWYQSGTASVYALAQDSAGTSSPVRFGGLLCLMLAAFSQSGVWPFHRWLISSCNAPTPVSSFMHAGLVNGGGLLLTRFAPLFFREEAALDILFAAGCISLAAGTLWKLVQTDVKRMLACSTMGQMGFMYMQCGLGLFPAAVAHLCWHGLFKAYLFLRSGSALQEKRLKTWHEGSSLPVFATATACGLWGAYGFAMASQKELVSQTGPAVLICFAWMAATQAALMVLDGKISLPRLLVGSAVCLLTGVAYGFSVYQVEYVLAPMGLESHRSLTAIQYGFLFAAVSVWLGMHLKGTRLFQSSAAFRRMYVGLLNSSQPASVTVTAHRREYQL